MKHKTIAAIGAMALLSLAGCSTSASSTSTVLPTPTASTINREAGILGTRVCVSNTTGRPILFDVTKADSGLGERQILNNKRDCAEGTFFGEKDVIGEINKGTADRMRFVAGNMFIGSPSFDIAERLCINHRGGYLVGDKGTVAYPTMRLTVERLPDDQWKEFDVWLTNGNGTFEGTSESRYCAMWDRS